jgi:hypothetical protein
VNGVLGGGLSFYIQVSDMGKSEKEKGKKNPAEYKSLYS